MSLNTFSAFSEEFPVDLSLQGIHEAAEKISKKRGLQFEEVLVALKNKQTEVATRCNDEKRRKFGRNHSFAR